ncbi:LppP/LprE family lipoprotein [Alicyclobacillus fastidiosus]|uniref:LppP/LprE family lipoprotein n=1 Tax=Alicyclobacillus fastidiosus TaxID=392011 RepID=A0ABV5ABP3_9BACL|nr:LppP/LprE family lipoprotein [Alicyclobacillus fastidiosus]WEH10348.1 LppP/LprE family lipoprotein [Alicyclobacillus fastidiosus]
MKEVGRYILASASASTGLLLVLFAASPAMAATSASGRQVAPVSHQAPTHMVVDGVDRSDPAHVIAVDPWAKRETSWVPLYYLQQSMTATGTNMTWNGRDLTVVPKSGWDVPEITSKLRVSLHSGEMDFLMNDGQFEVAPTLVRNDPASGNDTTYVPLYYVDQFLTKELGAQASWDGTTWTIDTQNSLVPTKELQSVMSDTYETGDASEHFAPSGSQVIVADGRGGTIAAVVGTRYPTADGLGQLVFFFHDGRFVDLNATQEVTNVLSVKPGVAGSIAVTYANYAPTDAMIDPTLPAETVTYTWSGSAMAASKTLQPGVTQDVPVTAPGVSN